MFMAYHWHRLPKHRTYTLGIFSHFIPVLSQASGLALVTENKQNHRTVYDV